MPRHFSNMAYAAKPLANSGASPERFPTSLLRQISAGRPARPSLPEI
jgi:hypothetical protein